MNEVNTILMIILSAMIGFGIGNAWGKEVMRRTMSDLLGQIVDGMKQAAGQKNEAKE